MNLNVEKILIIGLGMIGSSIALASKSKGIKVYGFDKSNNSIKEALEKNIIDRRLRILKKEGINFKCNIEIGKTISVKEINSIFDDP